MRRGAAIVLGGILAAACTGSAPDGPSGALPSIPEPVVGERLLVLLDDGSIVTTGPDGEDTLTLRGATDLDLEARQPVWSPDGSSVAWVEIGTEAPPAVST